MNMQLQDFEKAFADNRDYYFEGWKQFLRFKSISTDPAHSPDCRSCADWLVAELNRIGLKASILETDTKPVVYAEGGSGEPRIVYYGHYDVQPVDPLDAWRSDPFEPQWREGRLYARGAQDNKGQSWYFIKAVENLLKRGALNCSLKIFLEGEEESSSAGFSRALPAWKDKLGGDVLMVCDTGMYHKGVPAITMGLRGIIFLSVKLSGPRCDLHSGIHGGVAPNPALEMARLLATLHSADGSIAVKGYYDGCAAVDPEDLKLALAEPIDPDAYEKMAGVAPVGGERALSFVERRGFRPTIEINGIHSGYDGPGSKTIIPALATAKITSRLSAGQDPAKCLELLIEHIRTHAPEGLKLEISESGIGGPAMLVSARAASVQRAASVLRQLCGGGVSYVWEGASIPIVAALTQLSGAEPLLVGFGLEEDSIHAPNESFSEEQFRQGFLYVSLFLGSF